ncbi:tripartite tricarboxylate transporter substrate binding protein [Anaerosinus sp.]|uniref:tripartite tricarboxylate transporter substrate binding protein n=1 Tax=Selenobaculum sp. TaxID=3074374 RepID=UPI0015AC1AD7
MTGCTMTEENSNYPDKPINFIVPFSAGGGTDLQARSLENLAPKYLNQNFIILNKPGGAGSIGWNDLVNAAPDGYTIGISSTEILLLPLYGDTKYHYPTALEPLAQISTIPFIMVINAEQPWQNLDDLIQYSKHHPNELKFGHSGVGSAAHILGAVLAKKTEINLQQVPFRGGSESTTALLGNHVQIAFSNPAVLKEQIKSGRLRPLATTSTERLTDPDLSQIPTFKELGLNIEIPNWFGVVAPKELPPQVKAKLEDNLRLMINDPEFQLNLQNLGLQVEYLNSECSKKKWISDTEKLSNMIKETDILEQIQAHKQ